MNRWTAPCLSSAVMLVASCQYDPHAHRFSKHQPAIEEAAGTYVLDEVYVDTAGEGVSEKIEGYAATSQIVLRSDGTARFTRFPVFKGPDTLHYSYMGAEDFDGRWSIASAGCVSAGGNDSQTVYGIRFTFTDGRTLHESPTFTGSPRVDGMIFTFGDPDQGEILSFRKR
jgi:hypothetical protein